MAVAGKTLYLFCSTVYVDMNTFHINTGVQGVYVFKSKRFHSKNTFALKNVFPKLDSGSKRYPENTLIRNSHSTILHVDQN